MVTANSWDRKRRTPMSRIEALEIQKLEKWVTNKPDWSTVNPENGESGHQ
jgi:hypothetical protein